MPPKEAERRDDVPRDRDPPPSRDGMRPEITYKIFREDLKIWVGSADIAKNRQGGKVLRRLTDDARLAMEDLTEEQILSESGVDLIIATLGEYYAPYLKQTMPRAFEAAVYQRTRDKSQSLLSYTATMTPKFADLKREGVSLPSEAQGYIQFKHAKLSEKGSDMIKTWTRGNYEYVNMVKALRKLDKIHSEKGGTDAYFGDGDGPESYLDDPGTDEAEDSDEDDNYVYALADDLAETYAERDMLTALAFYQAVRDSLRKQKNERGYVKKTGDYPPSLRLNSNGGDRGKGGGKRRNSNYNKVRVHIDVLKLRTRCARRGQIGHWARECANPPDARGATSSSAAAASSHGTGSSKLGGNFFSYADNVSPLATEYKEPGSAWYPIEVLFGCDPARRVYEREPQGLERGYGFPAVGSTRPPLMDLATGDSEGLVDTAAQEGLVGKPALIRFTEALKRCGLCVLWTNKPARARGSGGKAVTLGSVVIPVGIGGVNGLLEATVGESDVPLLVPVGLLQMFRALVDLGSMRLHLRTVDVKAPMRELPTGNVAVDVQNFEPAGWHLPPTRYHESDFRAGSSGSAFGNCLENFANDADGGPEGHAPEAPHRRNEAPPGMGPLRVPDHHHPGFRAVTTFGLAGLLSGGCMVRERVGRRHDGRLDALAELREHFIIMSCATATSSGATRTSTYYNAEPSPLSGQEVRVSGTPEGETPASQGHRRGDVGPLLLPLREGRVQDVQVGGAPCGPEPLALHDRDSSVAIGGGPSDGPNAVHSRPRVPEGAGKCSPEHEVHPVWRPMGEGSEGQPADVQGPIENVERADDERLRDGPRQDPLRRHDGEEGRPETLASDVESESLEIDPGLSRLKPVEPGCSDFERKSGTSTAGGGRPVAGDPPAADFHRPDRDATRDGADVRRAPADESRAVCDDGTSDAPSTPGASGGPGLRPHDGGGLRAGGMVGAGERGRLEDWSSGQIRTPASVPDCVPHEKIHPGAKACVKVSTQQHLDTSRRLQHDRMAWRGAEWIASRDDGLQRHHGQGQHPQNIDAAEIYIIFMDYGEDSTFFDEALRALLTEFEES